MDEISIFSLSVSGHCCIDGSSIHQPIFCSLSCPTVHAPLSSPPHPSPNMSLAFLCFRGLSPCLLVSFLQCLVSFCMSEITYFFLFGNVQECSRCDSRVNPLRIGFSCVQSIEDEIIILMGPTWEVHLTVLGGRKLC